MAITPWRSQNNYPSLVPTWLDVWNDDSLDMTARDGLDVYETDDEVVVKAAVPGVSEKDVNVTYEDGILRIRGGSKETDEEKRKKKAVHKEQRIVSFDYMTTLPRSVDSNKISAEVRDGVITIKAPISADSKPKRIEVKANNDKKLNGKHKN
jgi:HSP20 family protein